MSLLMVAPGSAELVNVDELVSISMHGPTVVVRPMRRPDALGTQVLVDVVNAANVAGSTVMLRGPSLSVDSDVSVDASGADDDLIVESVAAVAAGVGLLGIRSEGLVWTFDYGEGRFVRSDRPIDPRFVGAPAWTAFEAVWIGPQFVRALTVDGAYVAGRRASQRAGVQETRDDRRPAQGVHDLTRPVPSVACRHDPLSDAHRVNASLP